MTRQELVAEVIVVGGGPAGSSTAFQLARAGVDVLVLDRATFPRDKPCSEYLSPQASRILHEMGALDTLERGPAARLTGMRVTAPDGSSFEGTFGTVRRYRPWTPYGLAVRRTILDALLLARARAAGARVLEGTPVTDLDRTSLGEVTGVVIRDGTRSRTLRARLVVGADGIRSVVARRARLGSRSRWPRRTAMVAHYRGVHLDGQVGDMHVLDDGYAGFAPVGGGLTNVALVVPVRRTREMHGGAATFMEHELARHPRLASRLDGAERVGEVRATGPFAWRARRAVLPGVALVGDAADFFDPFTGEGMYAALRGGELLCPYAFDVVRGTAALARTALEAYDRCRRHEFGGKWAVERIVAAVIAAPGLMNLAVHALGSAPDLATTLVGVTGDFVPAREVLSPRYMFRLLMAATGGDAQVQAGSTSPDAPVPIDDRAAHLDPLT